MYIAFLQKLDNGVAGSTISKITEACLLTLLNVLREIFRLDQSPQSINDYFKK